MISNKDIKAGDEVQFIYNAGSNRGMIRTVKVDFINNRYIKGLDNYTGKYRCFNFDNMERLQFNRQSKMPMLSVEHNVNAVGNFSLDFTFGNKKCSFRLTSNNLILSDKYGGKYMSFTEFADKLSNELN